MRIVPVPLLSDNYAYLVIDDASRGAAVVDPSEGKPVLARARAEGVHLDAIWCTHHHHDHTGGIADLLAAQPDLPVLGSAYDYEHRRIAGQTRGLADGDHFVFPGAMDDVRVMEIPGHTLGAIAYHVDGALFTGDTLFLAGCGRVFEGTMAQMQKSLGRLRGLPSTTQIWCGHEYTLKNLQFAQTVEPKNAAIAARLAAAQRTPVSVPGVLRDELATNPFLRWDVPEVATAARRLAGNPNADPFTALREAKDRF